MPDLSASQAGAGADRLGPMRSSMYCSSSLLLMLTLACGDDGNGGGGDAGGASSGTVDSTGQVDPSQTSSSSTSEDSGQASTTSVEPGDCVVQQGDGPCMIETLIAVPSSDIAYGDFDDDGDIDVLARGPEQGPQDADGVLLYTNDGGTFSEGTVLPFASDPIANDRPAGLAALRPSDHATRTRDVFVQGTYGALGDVEIDVWRVSAGEIRRLYEPTNMPPAGPWFGDFDGDGQRDIVLAPSPGDLSNLELRSCDATSCTSMGQVTAEGPPPPPWTVLATDTTGDALEELLVVRTTDDGLEVVVLENTGNGFTAGASLDLGTDLASSTSRVTDVDGDARGDLIIASTSGAVLHAFIQDGAGGLTEGPVIDAGERVTGYDVVDWSGDGTPDIALRRTDRSIINLGEGPSFTSGVSYELTAAATGIAPEGLPTFETAVVDLDGNGSLDMLTVTAQEGATFAVNVLIAN